MTLLQHEADVINLIGYETNLKFIFIVDNIIEFETIRPIKNQDGDLVNYEISFFYEDCAYFDCYSSFSSCLEQLRIFEVKEKTLEGDLQVVYHRKYNE